MCIDRLEGGQIPICVHSCSLRALDFGPVDELRKKYGDLDTLEELPDGSITKPSVVFKPRDGKKQLIPWDSDKALQLWQQRGPFAPPDLPPTFTDKEAVVNPPSGVRGRERLVLKPKTVEELMTATRDDE
jgi:anaerobic dimethyl sulfoxide reductase subunit B (iron-sulfur subunit)